MLALASSASYDQNVMRVKATREGHPGRDISACGWKLDDHVSFCALPSERALHMHVRIRNPENNRSTIAEVLDVGPWSEEDDEYVFHGARPLAENNRRKLCGHMEEQHFTNKAGIDLGEKVWRALGMKGNTDVDWEFIS